MDVYLARHGEAVADSVSPARPLTGAGRKDVEHVARLAAHKIERLSWIYHSGVLRAAQTAEILAAYLAPGDGVRPISGLMPEDDPCLAAAELAVATSPVMLVGHLPHLNRLAGLLMHGDAAAAEIDFAPAMLVGLRQEEPRWQLVWKLAPDPRPRRS